MNTNQIVNKSLELIKSDKKHEFAPLDTKEPCSEIAEFRDRLARELAKRLLPRISKDSL